jgi:DNA-binding beta-propeller fold protein YncE
VVKTINFNDGTPGYVKAFHDEKYVLVTDTKKGTLNVLDPAHDHTIVQTIPVGAAPDKVRISEDDKQVVVSLVGEPRVVMFTFGDDRTQAPQRKDFQVGVASGEHRDAAFDEGWIIAPNNGDNNVSLINLATGAAQTVTGGNNPGPVGIGTDGETAVTAIVGNAASNTISFFELPGGTATTLSDGVGLSPQDMVVDPDLHRAYLTMAGSNEVAVVDYIAKKLVGKVPVGNRPVHIYMAPVMPSAAPYRVKHDAAVLSHEIWVGNDAGASVTIFDGDSLRVKATVATDAGHHKMAFSGTKGYVSNITANNVSVIDRTQIK